MEILKLLAITGGMVLITQPSIASNEKEAIQKAIEATIVQTGLDKRINELVKRNFSDYTLKIIGNAGIVVKTVQEQQITLSWSF